MVLSDLVAFGISFGNSPCTWCTVFWFFLYFIVFPLVTLQPSFLKSMFLFHCSEVVLLFSLMFSFLFLWGFRSPLFCFSFTYFCSSYSDFIFIGITVCLSALCFLSCLFSLLPGFVACFDWFHICRPRICGSSLVWFLLVLFVVAYSLFSCTSSRPFLFWFSVFLS